MGKDDGDRRNAHDWTYTGITNLSERMYNNSATVSNLVTSRWPESYSPASTNLNLFSTCPVLSFHQRGEVLSYTRSPIGQKPYITRAVEGYVMLFYLTQEGAHQ